MNQDPAQPWPNENWQFEIGLPDLDATEALAREMAKLVSAGDLLILTGGLGAGKTTFTQAFAEALGVTGQVSSPTFVISRIHRSAAVGGVDLVHVDAYRTDSAGFADLDLAATMPDAVTVVEWGRGMAEEALAGSAGSWLDLELIRPGEGSDSVSSGAESPAEATAGSPAKMTEEAPVGQEGAADGAPGEDEDRTYAPTAAVSPAEATCDERRGVREEAGGWSAPGDEIITDFSETGEDLLGSPRRAVLRGYGTDFQSVPHSLSRFGKAL